MAGLAASRDEQWFKGYDFAMKTSDTIDLMLGEQ
jgi:hypothetical protein